LAAWLRNACILGIGLLVLDSRHKANPFI
jgi:hypothetical protein